MTTLTSRQVWQAAQELTFEEAYWYVYLPLDEHSLDPDDWWLMIGCCCKVASRLCMAVKQDDDRVRLLHTGKDVLSRMEKVYVETYLDFIDEAFRKSFRDSEDFEAVVSQAAQLTKRRGILAWEWQGPQENTLKDFKNPEALRLQLLGEWDLLSVRSPDQRGDCGFGSLSQQEFTRYTLFDLPMGLNTQQNVMWSKRLFSPNLPMTSFPESWHVQRAQDLKLISKRGVCKSCKSIVHGEELTRHLLQCFPRCKSCGCYDHRICQTFVAESVHVQRRSLLEISESTFVTHRIECFVVPHARFAVLFGDQCGPCTISSGHSVASTRRFHSSSIMIAQHNSRSDVEAMLWGFEVGTVLISTPPSGPAWGVRFSQSKDCCAQCGKHGNALTKLNMCSKCRNTMYCGKECQKLNWQSGHKYKCR